MAPNRKRDPLSVLLDRIADAIAERLASRFPTQGRANAVKARAGRKIKRDMRCRFPNCKNRSKGPRFRYLCEAHLKLPKKQQDAALQKWQAKKAA